MITITFESLPVSAYQDPQLSYSVTAKKTLLISGDIHTAVSPKTSSFPRSFDCFTQSYSEITALMGQIGVFGTLIISGVTYTDCYISVLTSIHEVSRGSGLWTYSIEFDHADQH